MMARRSASFQVHVDIFRKNSNESSDKSRSPDVVTISEGDEHQSEPFEKVSVPKNLGRDGQPINSPTFDTRKPICQNEESGDLDKESKIEEDTKQKLCGYLNKRRVGSALNQYKRRWFMYSESSCKLVYYRTATDIRPLGDIELACAAFTFDVANEKRTNVFRISSSQGTYILQAQDRVTMMYWMQQLQMKRKVFSENNLSATQTLGSNSSQQLRKGLLKSSQSLPEPDTQDPEPCGPPSLLDNIETPAGTVGIHSSQTQHANRWQQLNDFSFVNLKTEVKNIAYRRKHPDKPVFYSTSALDSAPSPEDTATYKSEPSILRRHGTLKDHATHTLTNLFTRTRAAKSMVGDPSQRDNRLQPTYKCSRCRQLHDMYHREREQTEALEEELQATKIVVQTLQNHITGFMNNIGKSVIIEQDPVETARNPDKASSKLGKDLISFVDEPDGHEAQNTTHPSINEDASPEQSDRTSLVEDLQRQISLAKDDFKNAKDIISSLQAERVDLQDQISMYEDSIQAKDAVVMVLTDRVSALEAGGADSGSSGSSPGVRSSTALSSSGSGSNRTSLGTSSPRKLSGGNCSSPWGNSPRASMYSTDGLSDPAMIQELKDECEAYRFQNRFLSQEILDLNRLREQDQLKERSLKVNYAKLEAKFYCIKSKYLVCLKQLHAPTLDGTMSEEYVNQETISEMLKDAMDSEATPEPDRPAIQEHEKYDKYGFWFIPPQAADDVTTRADSLQQKSDQLSAKANAVDKEISVQVKWENYMISLRDRPLERTPELKQLIRAGIPIEHRATIWNFCINSLLGSERSSHGQDYYQRLLKRAALSNSLNPAVTQVELDLLRTLPNNCHYESSSSEGIPKLRNVLLAFSLHNEDVGYCQGLNRLAAIALLFLEEEDAFWCLVALVEYLLPKGYYSKGLAASHIDQRVLKDLVTEKVPKVMQLLQLHEIDLAMFTFNWCLTLFVDNAPVETYLRIWDSLLFEGSKVLFRFSVAFFKYCEEDLLKQSDSLSLHNSLRVLGEQVTDVNRVADIAFNSINPFSMKYIARRRQFHKQNVKDELDEIHRKRMSLHETNNNGACSPRPLSSPPISPESSNPGSPPPRPPPMVCVSPPPADVQIRAPLNGSTPRLETGQRNIQYRSLNSDDDLDEG